MVAAQSSSNADKSIGSSQISTTSAKDKSSPSNVPKKNSHSLDHKLPVTTYIAIAAGCVGGLLLLMAFSAYFRRWHRQRHLRTISAADDDFVSKQDDPADGLLSSPTATVASSLNEEKRSGSPNRSHIPSVPPLPAAYHQIGLRTKAEAMPGTEFEPGHSAHDRPPSSSSHLRANSVPISIVTQGNSRTFLRPASELVLGNGIADGVPTSPQSYGRLYNTPQARHNSYASSSKYESLRPPSQHIEYFVG